VLFYLGTHKVNHARYFDKSFISINVLRNRKSDFFVNDWIMDSGAFTEISTYGYYRNDVSEYANHINRWRVCGNLEFAVTQDYMCEPFILNKTGLTVKEHQRLTIERYDNLVKLSEVSVLPVLQGYQPNEYQEHLYQYGDRLKIGMRVGVGSVCKRNSKPKQIVKVLEAIKMIRPDLKLHGFGLKITSLANNYILSLLYSSDSMAWSYSARMNGGNANGLQEALDFLKQIEKIKGTKAHQFNFE
jgi:hypothetical protein